LRSDERDVVGTGDEEVAHQAVHERGAHEDRQEPGRERRIEAQDDKGHEGPDPDDADDEEEVDSSGHDLKGEMSGCVHEGSNEMGEDEANQVPIETLQDSWPPNRKSLGPDEPASGSPTEDPSGAWDGHTHSAGMSIERLNIAGLIVP